MTELDSAAPRGALTAPRKAAAIDPNGPIAILAQLYSLLLPFVDANESDPIQSFPVEGARVGALAGAATASELRRAARHALLLRGQVATERKNKMTSGDKLSDGTCDMMVDGSSSPCVVSATFSGVDSDPEAYRAVLTSSGRVRPFPGLPLLAPLPESAFSRSMSASRAISRELSSLVAARVELDLVEWRQARLREQRERMARLRELDFGGYLAMLRARGSPRVEALLAQTECCFREIWSRVRERVGGGGREWELDVEEEEEEEVVVGDGGERGASPDEGDSLESLSSRWAVLSRAVMAEGERARKCALDRIQWPDEEETGEEQADAEGGDRAETRERKDETGKEVAGQEAEQKDGDGDTQSSSGTQEKGTGSENQTDDAGCSCATDEDGVGSAGDASAPKDGVGSAAPPPSPPRQPPLLRGGRLHAHQRTGLTWLAGLRHLGLNGILADDMGLGKTVQVVAALADAWEESLFTGLAAAPAQRRGGGETQAGPEANVACTALRAEGAGRSRSHLHSNGAASTKRLDSPSFRPPNPCLALIVVPASLVENWRAELLLWLPAARVAVYGGNAEERERVYDEHLSARGLGKLRRAWDGGDAGGGAPGERSLRARLQQDGGLYPPPLPSLLGRSPPPLILLTTFETLLRPLDAQRLSRHAFEYLIVDEAHRLKRASGRLRAEIARLRAARRVLLTGTPLQTEIGELWSLLDLLLPGSFGTATSFERWFGTKKGGNSKETEMEKRKEGREAEEMHATEEGREADETHATGEVSGKEFLFGGATTPESAPPAKSASQTGFLSSSSPPPSHTDSPPPPVPSSAALRRTLAEQELERERLESEEETLLVTTRLHQILRPFVLRRTKESVAWNLPPKRHVLLWCSRAPYQLALEGLARLGAGDAGAKRRGRGDGAPGRGAHRESVEREGQGGTKEAETWAQGETPGPRQEGKRTGTDDVAGEGRQRKGSETDAGVPACEGRQSVAAPPRARRPPRRSRELAQLLSASFAAAPPPGHPLATPPRPTPSQALARGWLEPPTLAALSPRHFPPHDVIPELRAPANLPLELRQVANHPLATRTHVPGSEALLPPHPLPASLRLCAKTALLDRLLVRFRATGHKSLVFSTQTAALDGIEDALRHRGIAFLRLDGSTPPAERGDLVRRWNASNEWGGKEEKGDEEDLGVFLLSVRAGGVGLNLQAADTVIMYDTDWNAQIDAQAQARAHRLGQTRPVLVVRLATAETVEESVLTVVRKRTELAERTIERGGLDGSSSESHRVEDLARFIAESSARERGAARERGGPLDPSDDELDRALARSEGELPRFRAAVQAAAQADARALAGMQEREHVGGNGKGLEGTLISKTRQNPSVETQETGSDPPPAAPLWPALATPQEIAPVVEAAIQAARLRKAGNHTGGGRAASDRAARANARW